MVVLLTFVGRLSAQEPYPGLDAFVNKTLQISKVPGAAVVIVRNDSIIYAKGFGVVAKGSSISVNDRTLFEIGSSGKSFTATAAAMLVSDGKLKYDDLLSKYLPDFKLYDPIASAQVTVRDALTHRSGIARGELSWFGTDTSRADVLHRIRFLKPESNFRSTWSYQNVMYLAAGEAAARAAGTSWEDMIQQRIFNPLGMTSSAPMYRLLKDRSNIATPHGLDHDTIYTKPFQPSDNIAPAGAIISNARDMGQWLRFQLNDGVVNGKRLVSTAALRETHIPQMIMGAGGGGGGGSTLFNTYGMGWMVQDYRHELIWQHGGNTIGMTTAMGMLPEKKIGVVVLSNLDHAGLAGQVMNYIFDRQLGVPLAEVADRPARQRPPDTTAAHVAGPPPLPLDAYVGTYTDSLYGDVTVSIQNGHLDLVRGLQHGPLEYWGGTNFVWRSSIPLSGLTSYIKFEVTPDNKVSGVYYGSGPETALLGRKNAAGGGRGGRGARGGGGGGQQ
jgi:CubicO group peptidase (beta-lactamase class C family)